MLESGIVPPAPDSTSARKKALIFGVSGQDGAYLAQFLLAKNYAVWGTSRHPASDHPNLRVLGILDRIKLVSCNMVDSAAIREILDAASPDEIYNLAGQTSVSYSFEHPLDTFHSIAGAALNLLECLRLRARDGKPPTRLFHASSAECFGDHGRTPATEQTAFRPKSPYGVAKASAHWHVACFREAFGLYACSGILFNHESPLRPQKFVTQKIVAAVGAIARGGTSKLHLGAIDIFRDWGWAPEYVEAMWLMLQQPEPRDFILATGHTVSLRDFVETAFAAIGRASAGFLVEDPSLLRPTEIQYSCADPSAIREALGWSAQSRMPDIVRLMLEADARAHAAAHVK
jgi:GDPmannose 4,6-dehydratase